MKGVFSLLIYVFFISGCSSTFPIKYSLDDVTKSEYVLPKTTIAVLPVKDFRSTRKMNEILFSTKGKMTEYEGRTVCLNSESLYKTEEIGNQVTTLLTAHLSKKYPNLEIVDPAESTADYQISSGLGDFFSIQDRSTAAALGAQFGILGALMTSKVTSVGEISISFEEILIRDKEGQTVSDIGTITKNWAGDFDVDGYCASPYTNINQKLKIIVEELVNTLGSEIEKHQKST